MAGDAKHIFWRVKDKLMHLAVPKTKKEAWALVSLCGFCRTCTPLGNIASNPFIGQLGRLPAGIGSRTKKKGLVAAPVCGTNDNDLGSICPS